jgi:hypothetical protein
LETFDVENILKERLHAQREESSASAGGGRWSAKRKVSVILELLRGVDLESTSRKYRVCATS